MERLKTLRLRRTDRRKNAQVRRTTEIVFLLILFGVISAGLTYSEIAENGRLWIGRFSNANPDESYPKEWEPVIFKSIKNHTQYRLMEDEGQIVIKATSKSASSGIGKKVEINLKDYPFINWRWKIVNLITKSNLDRKAGDDYPGRIYIAFKFEPEKATFSELFEQEVGRKIFGKDLPGSAIAYVWATSDPVGTIAPNPYSSLLRMIVVQSGEQNLNKWVQEKRNLYSDYKKAFGKEPTTVSSVVIMTDTDDTKESAVGYYGDIFLSKE